MEDAQIAQNERILGIPILCFTSLIFLDLPFRYHFMFKFSLIVIDQITRRYYLSLFGRFVSR